MAHLLGNGIRMVRHLGEHDILWRKCEKSGFLGAGELLKYNVYTYQVDGSKDIVPVFLQHDWVLDHFRVVTPSFQYGEWNGRPFLVYHDKLRYRPHQQSFICADVADLFMEGIRTEEEDAGFSFNWGFMDLLKDFDVPVSKEA